MHRSHTVTGLREDYAAKTASTALSLHDALPIFNDGNGGSNYTVNTVSDTSGVINQASLTITAATNSRTYDHTAAPQAPPNHRCGQRSDKETGLSEAYANKNAGTGKTLNVAGYTV